MYKKIAVFFILLTLSITLIPRNYAYADYLDPLSFDNVVYMVNYSNSNQWVALSNNNGLNFYQNWNGEYYLIGGINGGFTYTVYSGGVGSEIVAQGSSGNRQVKFPVILVKGSLNNAPEDMDGYFGSLQEYEDYINPPEPQLSWYEELFNDFIDYIGAGINNGIDGFLNWLREAWITPVGDGEDELALDLITPILTPTPLPTPTPIPYQTQLVPDGHGGFNITYIYNNPSGVPTSAPQPPTNQPQPTGSGYIDDDFDYPYYDNPNNKDDPYSLDIPWYLKFSFGGAVTSLDDFQDGMDAIVDNVNDQDENISVVMDSMGLFPSDWLLMIGFIGAIPLVGGLISRLLKG